MTAPKVATDAESEPECWVSQKALDELHREGSHAGTKTIIWNCAQSRNSKPRVPLYSLTRLSAAERRAPDAVAGLPVEIIIQPTVRRHNRVGPPGMKGAISTSCELAATELVLRALSEHGYRVVALAHPSVPEDRKP